MSRRCVVWFMVSMMLLLLPAAAADNQEPPRVLVTIRDYFGAEGFWREYVVTQSEITITVHYDDPRPSKEIFRVGLTPAQAKQVFDVVAGLPLERLSPEYRDTSVDDGMQVEYRLPVGTTDRSIMVANVCQPELAKVAEAVNPLTPTKYKVPTGCRRGDSKK